MVVSTQSFVKLTALETVEEMVDDELVCGYGLVGVENLVDAEARDGVENVAKLISACWSETTYHNAVDLPCGSQLSQEQGCAGKKS